MSSFKITAFLEPLQNTMTHGRTHIPICINFNKGLGAIRPKIGPTSDVDKMYSQYVLFRNKYT
jgi:hypothetical protein